MRSFTLMELLFVIIVIGVLAVTANIRIPKNDLIDATKLLHTILLDKKASAIGFEADINSEEENRTVCAVLEKTWLQDDQKKAKVKHTFSSKVTLSSNTGTICFDYLGRLHTDGMDTRTLSTLSHNEVNITLTQGSKTKTITLYPMGGFIEIRK